MRGLKIGCKNKKGIEISLDTLVNWLSFGIYALAVHAHSFLKNKNAP